MLNRRRQPISPRATAPAPRWLGCLACVTLGLLAQASTALAQDARPSEVRALVVEVIGNFCKLSPPAAGGVQIGDQGRLYRLTTSKTPIARVEITALEKEYIVGKVLGGDPELGDYVMITLRPPLAPSPEPATTPPAITATPPAEPMPAAEPIATEPIEPQPAPEAPATVTPAPPQQVDTLDAALDRQIDVEPKQGRALLGVKLLRVVRDQATGEARLLRVEQSDPPKIWMIGTPAIQVVLLDGQPIYKPGALPARAAGEPPAEPLAEAPPAAPEEPAAVSDKPTERPKSHRQLLAEQLAARNAEEQERWLARLEARGIEPWPKLTDEEHQAAIDEMKAVAKKIQTAFPGMVVHETKHFLVCTNIPAEQIGPYVISLDAMHTMMSKMYRIASPDRVWRGKALVVAFLEQTQFIEFERTFMQHDPGPQTYGLCHQKSNGEVIMACYRGDRTADFGHMLVHETSHGFIHRYKTAVRLPTWVNEGMAEWIGQALVPQSSAVKNSQLRALQVMQQTRSMGGDFLDNQGGLDTWQYGVASSLNDFLIRSNKQSYVKFIEGMKEGMDWKESLQEAYKTTPEQLVAAYGKAIGVPDLRP